MSTGAPEAIRTDWATRFDWYGATADDRPEHVLDALRAAFPMADAEPDTPRHGYDRGAKLTCGDETLAHVWYGGAAMRDTVHVQVSGWHCDALVPVLRRDVPHRCSRVDSCLDVDFPGSFDALAAVAYQVADRLGLKEEHAGDTRRARDGRTLYAGGRKSEIRGVLYEKGIERGVDRPGWSRIEVRWRPQDALSRSMAAQVEPGVVFALNTWATEVAAAAGVNVDSTFELSRSHRRSPFDKRVEAMARQYGKTLVELRERHASVEEFERDLFQRIEQAMESAKVERARSARGSGGE